jgi:hypothetical protein
MTGKLKLCILLTLSLAAFGCDEALEADPPDPDAVEDLEFEHGDVEDFEGLAIAYCEPGSPGCPCDVTGACWAGFECVRYPTAPVGVCEPIEPECAAMAEPCTTTGNECCEGLTCVNVGTAAEPNFLCR